MKAMCIMEVRPGAKTPTMLQAITHNLFTVNGDMAMLSKVLTRREDYEVARACASIKQHVNESYAAMLELFGESVARQAEDPEGHMHDYPVGSERLFIAALRSATDSSRKDETR